MLKCKRKSTLQNVYTKKYHKIFVSRHKSNIFSSAEVSNHSDRTEHRFVQFLVEFITSMALIKMGRLSGFYFSREIAFLWMSIDFFLMACTKTHNKSSKPSAISKKCCLHENKSFFISQRRLNIKRCAVALLHVSSSDFLLTKMALKISND